MNRLSVTQLEKRIIWIALAFVVVLLALSALAINLFHVGSAYVPHRYQAVSER